MPILSIEENLLKKTKKLQYTTYRFGTISGISSEWDFIQQINFKTFH